MARRWATALSASGNMECGEIIEPILSRAHSLVSPCFAYRFKRDGEADDAYLQRLGDELEASFIDLVPKR